MFYVWEFSNASEDFTPSGAFSHRAEADAFVAARAADGAVGANIIEEMFPSFVDRAVRSRLGALAKSLDKIYGAPTTAKNDPAPARSTSKRK